MNRSLRWSQPTDRCGKTIFTFKTKRPIESTMILGIGNIAGPGMRLADFFEASEPWTPADSLPQAEVLPANHVLAGAAPELAEVI